MGPEGGRVAPWSGSGGRLVLPQSPRLGPVLTVSSVNGPWRRTRSWNVGEWESRELRVLDCVPEPGCARSKPRGEAGPVHGSRVWGARCVHPAVQPRRFKESIPKVAFLTPGHSVPVFGFRKAVNSLGFKAVVLCVCVC